jgi:hypothetical protein
LCRNIRDVPRTEITLQPAEKETLTMAKDQTRRLSPAQIQINKNDFAALKAITDYAPANSTYKVEAIQGVETDLNSKQQHEAQIAATQAAARDDAVAKEWEHHNLMLGARDQVVAQFGRDSNEAQAVGLKKKSEYKSPGRKSTKSTPTK